MSSIFYCDASCVVWTACCAHTSQRFISLIIRTTQLSTAVEEANYLVVLNLSWIRGEDYYILIDTCIDTYDYNSLAGSLSPRKLKTSTY